MAGQDGDPITVRNFHLTLANSFWFAVGTLMQQGMLCCQALYVPPENMRVGLCACFCFVYSASHCRDSGVSLSIVCSVVEWNEPVLTEIYWSLYGVYCFCNMSGQLKIWKYDLRHDLNRYQTILCTCITDSSHFAQSRNVYRTACNVMHEKLWEDNSGNLLYCAQNLPKWSCLIAKETKTNHNVGKIILWLIAM